jgi:ABC-type Fe3+/spermidine/putrescine transport system ATPase subunit
MGLEVINLSRSYGDFFVSLDLAVEKGETLALVGPSGSGKTTALNLISGLGEAETGKVIIDGEDVSTLPCWKRNISLVFQDLALFPHLDVGGNIAYGLFVRKVPRRERRKIIDEALELVRLQGYASRRIHTLSGGEKQRVAIARSLASSPRALLLDEPFSSLDTPLRKEMRREFLNIRSRSDAPCVFVTHDQEEAAMLGDQLALMSAGRIIESAPGRELFLAPKTEFAALFFGAGQVLPCKLIEKRPGGIEVFSPLGALTVPPLSEYESERPMLFIPHDGVSLEEPLRAGWKSFSARAAGSIFEGSKLVVKLLLLPADGEKAGWGAADGEPAENVPFEMIAGPRTKPPAQGSTLRLWVDQSLLRFVR